MKGESICDVLFEWFMDEQSQGIPPRMLSGIGWMSRHAFLPTHEGIGQKPSDSRHQG